MNLFHFSIRIVGIVGEKGNSVIGKFKRVSNGYLLQPLVITGEVNNHIHEYEKGEIQIVKG